MLKDFREFALKGNMVDMAVGIVIGAAFTSVVNSIVADIFTPALGLLGGKDFSNYFVVLKAGPKGSAPAGDIPIVGDIPVVGDLITSSYPTLAAAKADGAVTMNYGLFLNAMLSFLIVSFVLFLLVKMINRLKRQQAAAPATPTSPPRQEILLSEIRDILKQKSGT